jgi:hypothetical protein
MEGVRQGGKLGIGCKFDRLPQTFLKAVAVFQRGGAPRGSPIHGKFSYSADHLPDSGAESPAVMRDLNFESAKPSVVKSIRQRDLLNTWLRLYDRAQQPPRVDQYAPERLSDELPDLVYYSVNVAATPPRLTIESNGTRMSIAYGHTGKGRLLDEYLGPLLAPTVMPVYYECLRRALPVYTISQIDDIYGRVVAYERLLLPFWDGAAVSHVIASLKTISEDGGFEISNLMRGNAAPPRPQLYAVIDCDLFHRTVGHLSGGDVLEFS